MVGIIIGTASHGSSTTTTSAAAAKTETVTASVTVKAGQAGAATITVTQAAAPAPASAAPASAAAAAPGATIPGDGTFIVGTDVKPGTYKSAKPDTNCYWARLKGDGGGFGDIIANNNSSGPSVVTIKSTDKNFQTSGCQEWKRV